MPEGMNSFESMPPEDKPERGEELDISQIEIGDRIYNKRTGSVRFVTDVYRGDEPLLDGYVMSEWKKAGKQPVKGMNQLVDLYNHRGTYELRKPELPEGTNIDALPLTAQERAALKQLEAAIEDQRALEGKVEGEYHKGGAREEDIRIMRLKNALIQRAELIWEGLDRLNEQKQESE